MPRGVSVYDEAMLQGRVWTPGLLLPGVLASWHEPSDLSNLTLSSGAVTADADRGPGGSTETQNAGASAPTLAYGVVNGFAVEKFNGSQTFNCSNLNTAPPVRTFIVVGSFPNPANVLTIYGSTGQGGLQFRVYANGLNFVKETVANIGSSSGMTLVSNTFYVLSGSYRQLTGAYSFRINGMAAGGGMNQQSLSGSASVVGTNPTNSGETMNGYLGGRICLNSDALYDIQRVEGHLAWKYGIPLAAGHPFTNRPPLIGD